jgi:hypothetical protein
LRVVRIYFIVWAPNGEECRLQGIESFIERIWGRELNLEKRKELRANMGIVTADDEMTGSYL